MNSRTKKAVYKTYLLLLTFLYVIFVPYDLLAMTVTLIVYFTIIGSIAFCMTEIS